MKKLVLIAAVPLLFSLVACGDKSDPTPTVVDDPDSPPVKDRDICVDGPSHPHGEKCR